jgi:deoxyadenosine/deoxycytidine kinase
MEQSIPLSYLKRLEGLYENWISNYTLSEILVLETDQLDFVHDLVDRLDVRERVEALLPSTLRRTRRGK